MFKSLRLRSSITWHLAILLPSFCFCTQLAEAQSAGGEVHKPETWRFGAFFSWGAPPRYVITNSTVPISADLKLDLFSAGFEAGRLLGGAHGSGPFRGQAQARIELMPLWVGRYPSQLVSVKYSDAAQAKQTWNRHTFFGASATPVLMRWNFSSEQPRPVFPWLQVGGGILWTNHKFPITMWAAPASVINFTPQVGGGITLYGRKRQHVDIGVKVVHISNAGLGDSNPGLNQTIQGVVSYSLSR